MKRWRWRKPQVMVSLQQMIYVFFKKRKEINIKLRMMHLPEGHLKYFTLSVWPAHRIGCVHWYKPLCSWDFTLSCRFLYFLEEKKKKVEDMLDRDYWHKRQKAQTLCWSQIAVQSLWPSWRVSNQKLWNGVMNLPGRLMSSVLDKKGNYVLSLLWDVLGNLGHILESMEGIKCRVEPADKCATGFSLYLLWEAGQLHRKYLIADKEHTISLCLYGYFWKPHLHFSVFLLLDFFFRL